MAKPVFGLPEILLIKNIVISVWIWLRGITGSRRFQSGIKERSKRDQRGHCRWIDFEFLP